MTYIAVYTKNNCPKCKIAKRILHSVGLKYSEINIEEKPNHADLLRDMGYQSLPVVHCWSDDNIVDEWINGVEVPKLKGLVKYYA
ncbi:glutaredoxin domain-containing protein [Ligilactobacillus agilis]|uniref:glutaredoxin domain-containing protein n=1 Tax=Ligilactobacillus agilis TaxID=1601 RepID=UPI001558679C